MLDANAAMKIILFANTEWYLYNFRRSLALALGWAVPCRETMSTPSLTPPWRACADGMPNRA